MSLATTTNRPTANRSDTASVTASCQPLISSPVPSVVRSADRFRALIPLTRVSMSVGKPRRKGFLSHALRVRLNQGRLSTLMAPSGVRTASA